MKYRDQYNQFNTPVIINANILALILLLSISPATAQQITLESPPTILLNETFTLNITVSANNITGIKFKLLFNNTILEALNISEGQFLKNAGLTLTLPSNLSNSTNNTIGEIKLASALTSPATASGNATLATVTFRTKSPGETLLDLQDVILTDENINIIPNITNATRQLNVTAGFTMQLFTGWNLVSTPLEPDEDTIEEIKNSVEGRVIVTHCDCFTDRWYVFNLDNLSDVPFEGNFSGEGVWVYVESNYTLPVFGHEPKDNGIELCMGWNLVGYNSLTERGINDSFSGLNGTVTVYAYNTLGGGWDIYNREGLSFMNTLQNLSPGRGYWLYSGINQTWIL